MNVQHWSWMSAASADAAVQRHLAGRRSYVRALQHRSAQASFHRRRTRKPAAPRSTGCSNSCYLWAPGACSYHNFTQNIIIYKTLFSFSVKRTVLTPRAEPWRVYPMSAVVGCTLMQWCNAIIDQEKLAVWCPVGGYSVCFNAPLEPFCLDKCPFCNHMGAEDDWMDMMESYQLLRNGPHTTAVLHHRVFHCLCLRPAALRSGQTPTRKSTCQLWWAMQINVYGKFNAEV